MPKEMSGHGKGRVKSIPKADRGIGKRVSQIVLYESANDPRTARLVQYSRCLENSYNLASVRRLPTTVSKITGDVRVKFRFGIGQ